VDGPGNFAVAFLLGSAGYIDDTTVRSQRDGNALACTPARTRNYRNRRSIGHILHSPTRFVTSLAAGDFPHKQGQEIGY
jgi:hypothetical protein